MALEQGIKKGSLTSPDRAMRLREVISRCLGAGVQVSSTGNGDSPGTVAAGKQGTESRLTHTLLHRDPGMGLKLHSLKPDIPTPF